MTDSSLVVEASAQQLDVALENAWQNRDLAPKDSLQSVERLGSLADINPVHHAKIQVVHSFHHGRLFRFRSSADTALTALQGLAAPSHELWLARSHGRLAVGLHALGDLASAYLEYQKQVKLARMGIGENPLFREELLLGYHNLGRHFYRIDDLYWAHYYFKKCYSLTDEDDFQLGFLLLNHAQCYLVESQYEAAQGKAEEAIKIGKRLGVERIVVYALPVLAQLSNHRNKSDEAEHYLLVAAETAENANLPLTQVQLALLEHYLNTRQKQKAAVALDAIASPKDVLDLSRFQLLSSQYYESIGLSDKALLHHKRYVDLQEQIFSLKKEDQAHAGSVVRRIKVLESEYEKVSKKNAELLRSIKSIKKSHRQMKAIAERDALTGLYNRRSLKRLSVAYLRLAKEESSPLSLAIIDVDHFKKINDTYGHAVGDEVLKAMAQISRKVLRGNDIIARIGGEEFVVLMPDTSIDAASSAMDRFRVTFHTHDWQQVRSGLKVTFSAGLTQTDGENSFSEVLGSADKCLYLAKEKGRNRIVVCETVRAVSARD